MLSYASLDVSQARQIHRWLLNQGFQVWVDWERLDGNLAWLAQVEQAIESATFFGLVLSRYSLRSGNCRLELQHAQRCGKQVLFFA